MKTILLSLLISVVAVMTLEAQTAPGVLVLQFGVSSTELSAVAKVSLDSIAAELKKDEKSMVFITAHCSSSEASDNGVLQKLSDDRAIACKNYLLTKGIAPISIFPSGHSDNELIAAEKTDVGKAANRRVEITMMKR